MNFTHNFFYYPNICHICKRFGKEISLKRCGNCKMISYCSKEHQKEHWQQHRRLCHAICKILKNNRFSNNLNKEENFDMEKWTEFRMIFMLMVAIMMGRKMFNYEEEMFKFLRSCIKCHDPNPKVLQDCPNCPSVSFCTKHREEGMHHKFCSLNKLCYDLDIIAITYKKNIPTTIVPCQSNIVNLPQDMKEFITQYVVPETDSKITKEHHAIISSEYITRPLTFLYALKKLEYYLEGNSLDVHIIAANMIDIIGMVLWENLLHWLPSIKIINIFLIGPELTSGSLTIKLCRNCKGNDKKLSLHMFNELYHTYVQSNSYVKPNLIIGYNIGIHECEDPKSEQDTWTESIKSVAEQNCPFIITSYTLLEAKKEQIRLKEVLGNKLKYTYFERNPYSSIRPCRDFESEGFYYQNQYIIIYENVKAS